MQRNCFLKFPIQAAISRPFVIFPVRSVARHGFRYLSGLPEPLTSHLRRSLQQPVSALRRHEPYCPTGDSVFDNGAYVDRGQPDVAEQVRFQVPGRPEVTLLATDGHYLSDVPRQMRRLPASATYLVLSVGGNDGLRYLDSIDRFDREVSSFSEAIQKLKAIRADFQESYHSVAREVLDAGLPTTLCTIYNGNFPEPRRQALVDTILPALNDVIIEVAIEEGLPLIDLGRALDEPDLDYANSIEPAAPGGEKIARAIAEVLGGHDFQAPRTEIYT